MIENEACFSSFFLPFSICFKEDGHSGNISFERKTLNDSPFVGIFLLNSKNKIDLDLN